jgi:hypothetical protein
LKTVDGQDNHAISAITASSIDKVVEDMKASMMKLAEAASQATLLVK